MTYRDLKEYFRNEYVSIDEDPYVIEHIKKSYGILDVGCGDNLFKKHLEKGFFIGLDPYNLNADEIMDIIDFNYPIKFNLIICFGSINFYDIKWVDDRMKKVASLLAEDGRICMKVNPKKPFGNGVVLDWFDKWTLPLVEHYAVMFNYTVENIREGEYGRIKFDYVAR